MCIAFQVLSFDGDEVFNADITLFENATTANNYMDMCCVDALFKLQTGCMKVVFLNSFVQDLLVCSHFLCFKWLKLCLLCFDAVGWAAGRESGL